jgi:hypothetical protein
MTADSEVERPAPALEARRELALVTTLEGFRAWFREKLILWPYESERVLSTKTPRSDLKRG